MLKFNSIELSKSTVAVNEAITISVEVIEVMPTWGELLAYKWDNLRNVTRSQLEKGYIE